MNDPKSQEMLMKIVGASMKMLYDPSMRQHLIDGLSGDGPIEERLAHTVAGVLKLVDDRMSLSLPKRMMVPAGVVLLQNLADFLKESTGEAVTDEQLIAATKMLADVLAKEYQMIDEAKTKHQGQQQAPQQGQPQPAPADPPAPTGLLNQGAV